MNIGGSGWQPGETVSLTLIELPLYDTHGPYTATADSNGKISNSDFVTDRHDLNIRFYPTAKGSVSQAQMTFTDGNTAISGTVTSSTGTPIQGASISCTSGCNANASTTTNSAGAYSMSINFSGNSNTVTLTASATGFNSGTLAGIAVTNGSTLGGNDFKLTPIAMATTTSVSSSANSVIYGKSVTFTAKVVLASGTIPPAGTVQFVVDSNNYGSPVTLSSCAPTPDACASIAITTLTDGSHTILAKYSPTGAFTSSPSTSLAQTVTARSITVTAYAQQEVYGDTDPALTYKVTSGSLVNATVSFTHGCASNYTVFKNTATNGLTVTPATLTITPDGGKTKRLGETFTAFTGTVAGLQNGDTLAVTYSSPGASATAAVGTYDITVAAVTFTSGSSSNYTLVKNTATKGLTVSYNAACFTIRLSRQERGDLRTYTLTFTAGGAASSFYSAAFGVK